MTAVPDIALLLASTQSPAQLVGTARHAEACGFAELWLGEDYCYHGGVAAAGALLAHTTLPVGLGIAPVLGRHPAVLAMELATLAGIYPGRLRAGIGAGVPELLDQLGLHTRSPLGAMRDGIAALRGLLNGDTVTLESESFALHDLALTHAPASATPLYLGVSGPKALRLSGARADGTVLSVLSGTDYVRWARERLDEGGADAHHRVVVYALCAVDDDGAAAREMLRQMAGLYLLLGPRNPLTEAQGIADEAERLAALGIEQGTAQIPDEWLDELCVCGTPEQCARTLAQLADAGADAVALCFPADRSPRAMLDVVAGDVLPRLRALTSDHAGGHRG